MDNPLELIHSVAMFKNHYWLSQKIVLIPLIYPLKILTPKGESDFAVKGQAVTLTLDKEVDISRGDLLCSVKNHNYFLSDQFASHIIWMNKEQMIPERNYIFKFINFQTIGKITDLVHKININSFEKIASKLGAAVKIGKEAFYKQLEMPIIEAYEYTGQVMAENMMLRQTEKGIDAFLNKLEPAWEQD